MPTSKNVSTSTSKKSSTHSFKKAKPAVKKKPVEEVKTATAVPIEVETAPVQAEPEVPSVVPVEQPIVVDSVQSTQSVEASQPINTLDVMPHVQVMPQAPQPVVVDEAVAAPAVVVPPTGGVPAEGSEWGTFRKADLDNKKGKLIPLLIILIILLLLLAGSLYYWFSPYNTFKAKIIATPTNIPSLTSTPTPTVNLTLYSVEILNGSGVAGEAAAAQSFLEEEGFKVSSIGNAPDGDFEDAEVAAKEGVSEDFIKKLKEVLEENYGVSSEILELDEDNSEDVVITLGSNINE